MPILVTGGAGFIGSHLVRHLVQRQAGRIVVLDNIHRGKPESLPNCAERVRFLQQDIRDRAAVEKAVCGCHVVFHLAAQSNVMGSVQDPEYCCTTNVLGTLNVLEAARAAGVKRVVFTSSREIYGDLEAIPVPETAPLRPKNAYGISKASGELYCRMFAEQGLEAVVLRLANVYGPGDRDRVIPTFSRNALAGEPMVLYGGQQVMDFVWVDTVVDALYKAAFGPWIREPLNIGSGSGTSIERLAHRILHLTGSASRIEIAPARSVEVTRFVADMSRASKLLKLDLPADPLYRLPELLGSMRKAFGHENALSRRLTKLVTMEDEAAPQAGAASIGN